MAGVDSDVTRRVGSAWSGSTGEALTVTEESSEQERVWAADKPDFVADSRDDLAAQRAREKADVL